MTKYNLHWCNLTITKVDWERQEMSFKWDYLEETKEVEKRRN